MRNTLFVGFILLLSFRLISQEVETPTDSTFQDQSAELIAKYERLLKAGKSKTRKDSLQRIELVRKLALLEEEARLSRSQLEDRVNEIEAQDSTRNATRKEKIFGLKESSTGHPVSPFSDTLFFVYLKIGPILPDERAASITQKIQLLYKDNAFEPDSIKVIDHESTFDVVYGDMILTSVTDWDALWFETTGASLAQDYAGLIRSSISEEKKSRSVYRIVIRIGLVLVIIVLAIVLIFFLNRLFKKATHWVHSKEETFFKGIRLKSYEFLPPKRQLAIALQFVNLCKWLVFVVILYISLPLIFSIFPFTQGWATTLFTWIWDPARSIVISFVQYLPNIFSIGVIFIAVRYLVRFIKFLSDEIASERLTLSGFHADWAAPTFNIVRVLLYAFMFVAIFPYLPGSDSPIFQGVSVFLGILFSLGSSTAIANMVSGLVITYMRPFKIGDRVKIGEITGDIMEKSLLVTRIRTTKNEYITVPNASVLTGHTVNYTTSKDSKEGLILHTTVTLGYDVPWRKVHEVLIAAAKKTADINLDKEPFILQTSLDDYYVSYQLNAYSFSSHKMAKIYSELHQNIQDMCNEAGIEILSPHYRALRDGNVLTVPPEYIPEDYEMPGFNVKTEKK